MADATSIKRVKDIINKDSKRRYIIVSAPGKRFAADPKITDVLYSCYAELQATGSCKESFNIVRNRFISIVNDLHVDIDIDSILDETERRIIEQNSRDFTASRGEYLSARVASVAFGATFIDTEGLIFFKEDGSLDEDKSYKEIYNSVICVEKAVLPGFYGTGNDGKVRTFSRGGSDITGAVVARGVGASLYENWTDVSGLLACDPKVVTRPKSISLISYEELRELSSMGANVLHSESIQPVKTANIPVRILNTFKPDEQGTDIIKTAPKEGSSVTAVTGRENFTVITIKKSNMNSQVDFISTVLNIVSREGLSIEHVPSGIDTLSLVLQNAKVSETQLNELIDRIKTEVQPDTITLTNNISLIAVVGHGMRSSIGTFARLFTSLATANINVKMIDHVTSDRTIIVGVQNGQYKHCIKTIYHEFFD